MNTPIFIQNPRKDSRDEINILKNLHHKSIVKYLTSFRGPGGSLCIVMEYCDHGTLTSAVKVCTVSIHSMSKYRAGLK